MFGNPFRRTNSLEPIPSSSRNALAATRKSTLFPRYRKLRIESLEDRQLLAISAVGGEFLVNHTTLAEQGRPAVAMDSTGNFVVTWESEYQDGDDMGVFAQLYTAAGVPRGSEFQVNTSNGNFQWYSDVAMDSTGNFVVTWRGPDVNASGVFAQRYDSAGVRQGSEFRVNTYTRDDQFSASVAMDSSGDFVVAWHSDTQDGYGAGIYAQRYNAAGVPQGSEFQVNTYTTSEQSGAAVANDSAGNFVIVWQSNQDGSGYGVYAQRYSATGALRGTEFRVNSYTLGNQFAAKVAVDTNGDFVVTWHSSQDGDGYGIYAQRYNSSGAAQGSAFRVNTLTTSTQYYPDVAIDSAGNFVVTWESYNLDGSHYGVAAQRYTSTGVPIGSEFRVNTFTTGQQNTAAVASSPAGDFVVAWQSPQDGHEDGVYAQLYSSAADLAPPRVLSVTSVNDLIVPGGTLFRNATDLAVHFTEQLSTAGGSAGAASVTNLANWQLTRNSIDVSSQIAQIQTSFSSTTGQFLATASFSSPLSPGSYTLTLQDDIQDLAGNRLDGDANGAAGGDFAISFNIPAPAANGSEFIVNTYTTNTQALPAIAVDADGDFVVVWQGSQAGDDIYAQRHRADGTRLGSEFRVNTYTSGSQIFPAVSTHADGDFVVVWKSMQDGDGFGIFGQRFEANGARAGNEFRVNTYAFNAQQDAAVAMDAAGNFVVVWGSDSNQDGNGEGVYAQRYRADGTMQGSEFRVNTYTTGDQSVPHIAMDALGNFVVVWQASQNSGGDSYGIYAQRYSADGAPQGGEFHVNTVTASQQLDPTVAMNAKGDFVVVWHGGSNSDVRGQLFNAAGAMVGNEFRANSFTIGPQEFPSVSIDAAGGFVITWESDSQDNSGGGIYGQRYNSAAARLGSEFQVNAYTPGQQNRPAVASDVSGNFVVTWYSRQDGSLYGVYAQRYAGATDIAGPQVAHVYPASAAGVADSSPILQDERETTAPARLVVVFSENMATTGLANVNSVHNWQLQRNGVDVTSQISGISFGYNGTTNRYEALISFSMPITEGVYELTARSSLEDLVGRRLDGNFDGTAFGEDYVHRFSIGGSGASGSEFRVNTFTTGSQISGSNKSLTALATDSLGNFVVAWAGTGASDGSGIFAQRYNAAGVPQGSEFRVNTYTTNTQEGPFAAMSAAGDFVIAWSSNDQDGSSAGVYAQRYSAAGAALGSEFRVNSYTTSDQLSPTVAMDQDGDFVVAWEGRGTGDLLTGIFAQRYSSAGVPLGTEFHVNVDTLSGNKRGPKAAMDPDGDFVIAWSSSFQDASSYGVYARRFNSAGVAQGSEFRVNTYTTGDQQNGTPGMDAAGNFVVTWESRNEDGNNFGVYAQRYSAAGAPLGSEFVVNTNTMDSQRLASVGVLADGDFIITWQSNLQDGSNYGIYARKYDAAGAPQSGEFRVNSTTFSAQIAAHVAVDGKGNFVVGWSSLGQDGSGYGVYAQRYAAVATVRSIQVTGDTSPIEPGERLVQSIASGPNLAINFSRAMSQVGGAAGARSVTNPANYVLTRNGVDISGQITSVSYAGTTATLTLSTTPDDGAYTLTAKSTIDDADGRALDGDSDGSPGGNKTLAFAISQPAAAGSEFRVNSYTTGNQGTNDTRSLRVAMDASGDFVAVWTSFGQDGNNNGVYAQRFSASGIPSGSEFRVNSHTVSVQFNPSVAMDSSGNFVVTWSSYAQDGNNYGIYAQRFNSAGAPLGSEFRINDYTTGAQWSPRVAMDSDGDFAIAWVSDGQDGDGMGIFAQRYTRAGIPQGSSFRVNTYTTDAQTAPAIAMSASGDMVIAWDSLNQQHPQLGVYAQRYNASGAPVGTEFRVHGTAGISNSLPRVAMDSTGNFVIAWQSHDGTNYDVRARRFDSSGTAQGTEFRVNSYTTGQQSYSEVSMDDDGDFVVTWSSASQDTSQLAIFAQRYNAFGAPQGSEFQVNTYTSNHQFMSAVAMDADGDFAVVWTSALQDGHGYGIYGQRFAGSPPIQVVGLTPTYSGFEVELNRDFDASVINLYDQEHALGAADVTLTGSSTGAVRGSVVIEAGSRKLTFLKSGGPLLPDTYTLNLRSNVLGFKDPGQLLDGNGDGVAGDDDVARFTITPPPSGVTVTMGDFTRGYGQAVNVPASASTGLPITISSAVGVRSASFALSYDPALLTITGVTLGSGITGTVSLDISIVGILRVTVTSATQLSVTPGAQTLINLTASVPSTVPYTSKQALKLTAIELLDASLTSIPAIADDGMHIAAYLGDANADQAYNSPDATLAQRLIVGIEPGLAAYQLADPYLIVDVNRNGQLQSDDVTQIQRAIVGLSSDIPSLPGLGPAATGGPDPIISIPQNLTASVGDTISVPVELLVTETTAITIAGADISIAYDAATLKLTQADVGQLFIGFGLSVNTSVPGVIRLTLGGSPLELAYSASGILATLQFTVLGGAGTSSSVNLLHAAGTLRTALYDPAGNPLTLSPAPTDDADDSVDGLLTIEPSVPYHAIDAAFDELSASADWTS